MNKPDELKKIIIVGAGGMGGDTQWLIERVNQVSETYQLLGYIDDGIAEGTMINGFPVLGGMQVLKTVSEPTSVAFAIGNPGVRKKLREMAAENPYLNYPNLIDPSVIMSDRVQLGEGNIICASVILTMNPVIGDFNLICNRSIVGHDDRIANYNTLYPGVLLSGNVTLEEEIELGTGSQVIQGLQIGKNVVIGAGGTVIRNIREAGTYVGTPVRKVNDKK